MKKLLVSCVLVALLSYAAPAGACEISDDVIVMGCDDDIMDAASRLTDCSHLGGEWSGEAKDDEANAHMMEKLACGTLEHDLSLLARKHKDKRETAVVKKLQEEWNATFAH